MPDRRGLTISGSKSTARVFFALWPRQDCLVRCVGEAARLHALCGGRETRGETIHLTLVFIGDIERDILPRLIEAASTICVPPFAVDFDTLGYWRHNRIAYLAPTSTPEPLLTLVTRLEAALTILGVEFDRRCYKPHITLVRRGDCPEMRHASAIEPITWPADEFVLVESVLEPAGATYAPLARFKLS